MYPLAVSDIKNVQGVLVFAENAMFSALLGRFRAPKRPRGMSVGASVDRNSPRGHVERLNPVLRGKNDPYFASEPAFVTS